MAKVSEMFDQLRDLISDQADAQVTFANKKLYLNRGIARMWPIIRGQNESEDIILVAGQTDYPYDWTDRLLTSVEISSEVGGSDFNRFVQYDIVTDDFSGSGVLRVRLSTASTGYTIRLRTLTPISPISAADYTAAQSEDWSGDTRSIGLPVLYAMGMIAARKLDDRQDTTRYSTTVAMNGVTDTGIMTASNFWFGQFEAELLAMERPLPIARD